jgi:hypothetical protein
VKPDAQIWQPSSPFNGVGRGRSPDHQACGAQNAAPVRRFDSGVDFFAQPEIVRSDDQMVQ